MGLMRVHTTVDESLYSAMIANGYKFAAALELGCRIQLGEIPHPYQLVQTIVKYQKRMEKELV